MKSERDFMHRCSRGEFKATSWRLREMCSLLLFAPEAQKTVNEVVQYNLKYSINN